MKNKKNKSLLDEMLEDPEASKPFREDTFWCLAKQAAKSRWRKIKKGYKKLYDEVKEEEHR